MNEKNVIDQSAIQKIREMNKPGRSNILIKLITIYQDSSLQYMSQIRNGVISNDLKKIASVAHTLKSSSQSLGAIRFSMLCVEIEKIGNGIESELQMQGIFKLLEEEYSKVVTELAKIKQQEELDESNLEK